ncbi:ABC transporter substrate-binding protein [Ancylobacter sp. VNQ12]|uniref:ABC transporter substrate-binding protein n=1 Tax=Ancylobacter sp. VNQ12 TaxID=3400920 RepID=UPI003C067B03
MVKGLPKLARKLAGIALSMLSSTSLSHAQDAGLKIGAVIPLTGTYGSYGKALTGAMNIAVEEINAAGGVTGKPVELLIEDDQTDPTAGLNAARKLIDVNQVNAIVGTFASSVTLPVMSYTQQVKIPLMTVSGAPEISQVGKDTGMVFRFVSTEGAFGTAYARYAKKEGLNKAYLLTANNAAQLDAAANFETTYKAEGGEVLGKTIFEPNQSSYRSEVTKALAEDPSVIMLAAYTNDAIIIAKTIAQLNPDVKIVGPLYALGKEWVDAVGSKAVEGTLAIDAMSAEDSNAYKHLAPLYTKAVGEAPTGNPYAVMDYDMIITLALAAEAAKSTDPAVFAPFVKTVANQPGVVVSTYAEGLAALKEGKDIDYSGASSPVDFDESGDLASMFMRAYKIEGGQAVAKETIEP